MAYLNEDEKLEGQGGQPGEGQGGAPGGSGGFVGGGSPLSQAGVGAGGQGWTNIQSYLSANQGAQQGSVDAFNKQVGSQLDSDKSKLDTSANETRQKAQESADKTKVGQDQASKLIEQAGQNYQYGVNQDAAKQKAYQEPINQIRGVRTAQWGGPNSFVAGMGGDAQQVGGLNADPNFRDYMNNVYRQGSGGHLGVGGLNLQAQLDANNEGLASARQQALGKYADLQNYYNTTIGGVNADIGKAKEQFGKNKADFDTYLNDAASSRMKALQDRVNQYGTEEKALKDVGVKHIEGANLSNGLVDAHYLRTGTDNKGNKYTQQGLAAMNEQPYRHEYQAGDEANLENIGGSEAERGQYNAIMDALGLSERINQADKAAEHGKAGYFDDEGWNRAVTEAGRALPVDAYSATGGGRFQDPINWGEFNADGYGRRGIDAIEWLAQRQR